MDHRQIVGYNIQRLRKQRGLSQEALADLCGLHRTYIGTVERGEVNISLDNIQRIAVQLAVEPYVLLRPPRGGSGPAGRSRLISSA
jgi:transcriptional regulator with XRE-family HTH domain